MITVTLPDKKGHAVPYELSPCEPGRDVWACRITHDEDGKTVTYRVALDRALDGEWRCSCPGYFYRTKCKHLEPAKQLRQEELAKMDEKTVTMPTVPTQTAPQQSRPPQQPPAPAKPGSLASITTQGRKLPSRIVMHAIPKWGKTSFAAHAPRPIFLMTRGEDGLLSLMDAGRIEDAAHYPDCFDRWSVLMGALKELAAADHNFKTLVLDTLNGAERLAHEATCNADCDGNWDRFTAFGSGLKLAMPRVIELTTALDKCRERGMGVLLLAHSQVKKFNNPDGPDYDRWEPVLAPVTWAHLERWADMTLFGQFETAVEQKTKGARGKGVGGQQRVILTERTAAYDAGNRAGLPGEISGGTNAGEAWANFIGAMKKERA